MEPARADPYVESIAASLARAKKDELLLFAMTSFKPLDLESQARPVRARLAGDPTVGVVDEIIAGASVWRRDLSEDERGHRKGAIIERLVQKLLAERIPAADVYIEYRVEFSDGQVTTPIDVLGTCGVRDWEAIECKAGLSMGDTAELSWTAKTSTENDAELMVVVASAAARDSLVPILRRIKHADAMYYVSAETIFELAVHEPSDRVPVS